MLLVIRNKVLDTCLDTNTLDTLHGVEGPFAIEIGIRTKTMGITGASAQR